ncbi:hypothetical protein ACP70R_001979 [Stipagrostis hirtigluma subsp. patula]
MLLFSSCPRSMGSIDLLWFAAGFAVVYLDSGEMSKLANMFAVLNLDAEDDRDEVEKPASSNTEADATTAKLGFENHAHFADKIRKNHTMIVNYDGENLASSSSDYKMPLVWIDLEMTGLDITKDRILEIACIITDGKLTKRIEGPDLVIRQSQECIDNMNVWCKTHHVASGLAEEVLKSKISEHDAEEQVLDFIRRYIGSATPLIAGNSVYMDLLFLKKYMPQLAGIFSHVIVDVSSITALCIRWFPKGFAVNEPYRAELEPNCKLGQISSSARARLELLSSSSLRLQGSLKLGSFTGLGIELFKGLQYEHSSQA